MKKLGLLIGTALAAMSVAVAAPEVGQPAPEFTLKDSTGQEHSLADFKGKTVVLEWYNFGCPFVAKHYDTKNMQNLQKEATDDGVVWLSIISSAPGKQGHLTPEQAEAKKAEVGAASTALLIDEDGTVGKAYDAKTTPEMFVINAEGVLVYKGAIDDNSTADKDSVEGANNYVKAALTAVKAGEPVETSSTKPYGCSVKYQ